MGLRLACDLTALVAPPRCAACGRGVAGAAAICGQCDARLRAGAPLVAAGESAPPGIDPAVAVSPFEGAARAVVHGLKYGRRLALAEVAAEAMLRACPPGELRGQVVPVPAAPWRRRWRGFDPAEEIAMAFARLSGLRYRPCLRRAGGSRQVGRRRSERLADPPRVWAPADVPLEACLVDDVQTTGATIAACAAALRVAGCQRVLAVTLARAL